MLTWKGEALQGRSGHEAGRQLLQTLYEETVGGPMPPIAAAHGGKPYFEKAPWHFSISHTDSHVFCVLSDVPVGMDAEELRRKISPKLAAKVLSPEEWAQYEQAPDRNRAFLTFWVLKEASAKCSGRGVHYPENHTQFSLTDSRVFEDLGCLVAIVTEDDYAI